MMLLAVEINQLLGALIAVSGAMIILGVSMTVAKHLGKHIDEKRKAKGAEKKPEE